MASDVHLTREILLAAARGEMPNDMLVVLVLDHLVAQCATCRAEIAAFMEQAEDEETEYDYGPVFERLTQTTTDRVRAVEAERKQAAEDFANLLKLPEDRRLARIERAWKRFRSPLLADLLLDEARRSLPTYPHAERHFATLAARVAARGNSDFVLGIRALALAHQANAERILGNRHGAGKIFASSRGEIRYSSITDILVYAEVDWLEGLLYKDLRQFSRGEMLLTRSTLFYRLANEPVAATKPQLSLSALYNHAGRPEEAAEIALQVADTLDPAEEPRLYLCARFNHALFLNEAGETERSRQALLELTPLLKQFPDRWTQLRVLWLEGRLANAEGDPAGAEGAFRAVRAGFITDGMGYDAALVSLDLALLYLEAGRMGELKRLAEEMHPIFVAEDVHREAAAALVLLQDALRSEALSAAFLEEVATYLKRARRDPGLRFGDAAS